MRLRVIALVTIAFSVSTSALPRPVSERNAEPNPSPVERRAKEDDNKGDNKPDPQSSLTLDKGVICSNFEQNGLANATAGQAPSSTSSNNFINFCLTVNKPLTNGQQIKGGSCNPAPMGVVAPSTNMPSSKFVHPKNLGAIKANTTFEIKMGLKHLEAGHFVNPDSNYFAAPQQLNAQEDIIGHTHFVIERLSSITSTAVSDPSKFAFFKGVNTAADAKGHVAVNVTNGLPEGIYKLSSINSSANHAPVVVAIAQHGSLDDQVYFFVTPDGKRPEKIV